VAYLFYLARLQSFNAINFVQFFLDHPVKKQKRADEIHTVRNGISDSQRCIKDAVGVELVTTYMSVLFRI